MLSDFIIREYIKFGIVLNYTIKAYTLHTVDTLDIYYVYAQGLCIYFTGEIDFKTLCRLYYIGRYTTWTRYGRTRRRRSGPGAVGVPYSQSCDITPLSSFDVKNRIFSSTRTFTNGWDLSLTTSTPSHEPPHATCRLDDGIL